MNHLAIRDTAILVGYNPEGACIYSTQIALADYWDGEHVWDRDEGVKKLRLARIRGYLFDSAGELLQEFESNFNLTSGVYASGWARHADGTFREDKV